MRLAEIKGFVVYDIYQKIVFQRGHLLNKDYDFKKSALRHYGIDIVIGLARDEDEDLKRLQSEVFGFLYWWNKIPDGKLDEDNIEYLLLTAEAASDVMQGFGMNVLSYCNAGRNRSGLMNALILRELLGCTGKEAMEIVRRERPRAIDNEHFERFLLGLGVP